MACCTVQKHLVIYLKYINQLEDCDKIFLRRLFEAELGAPVEAFLFDTFAWSLIYTILGRQLMCYWTILRKGENEHAKDVFNTQKDFPTAGEWHSVIQGVLEKCNINYSENEIRKMSKGGGIKWARNG